MTAHIASTHTATDRNTNSVTLTATPPSGRGAVAFLYVAVMRTTSEVQIDQVACRNSGGTTANMAPLSEDIWATNNRHHAWGLYKLEDPIDVLGSGEHVFEVITSRSAFIAITLVYVTGVTEIRTAATVNAAGASLTNSITNDFTPSLILAGGFVRVNSNPATQFSDTDPTGDTTGLTKIITGYNANTDLIAFSGYAEAETVDTYAMGWEWGTSAAAAIIAVEIVGEYEPAALALGGVAPAVILGDILIEGLAAALALGGGVGETGLGSIPPVQVIGRGNLFFATNARNLTAILLATTGDKWTIATAGGSTEQLGCTIIRRKGYITPR